MSITCVNHEAAHAQEAMIENLGDLKATRSRLIWQCGCRSSIRSMVSLQEFR